MNSSLTKFKLSTREKKVLVESTVSSAAPKTLCKRQNSSKLCRRIFPLASLFNWIHANSLATRTQKMLSEQIKVFLRISPKFLSSKLISLSRLWKKTLKKIERCIMCLDSTRMSILIAIAYLKKSQTALIRTIHHLKNSKICTFTIA